MKYLSLLILVISFSVNAGSREFKPEKNKRKVATSMLTVNDLIGGTATGRTPVVTRRDMEVMTPQDRALVRSELNVADAQYDRFLLQHCTTQRDGSQVLDESCGRVDVSNGDPNFQPERIPRAYKTAAFANVPKGSNVEVHTKCHNDGKFYTQVMVNGKPWANPYNGQTKWLTSPGQYFKNGVSAEASDSERGAYRTRLPVSRSSSQRYRATGTITQWHIVSDAKSYAGAEMPFTVWLNNSGHAYHAGTSERPVDGYPASAGCFRLDEDNAKGLFNLTRRVGTNNMSFYWYGYTNDRGKLCTRPSNAPNAIAADINEENSRRSRENVFDRIGNWLNRTFGGRSRDRDNQPSTTDR